LPSGYGSAYVDVGLRIIVAPAAGTLSALRPDVLHGTTETHSATNYGLSLTMTRRVSDAYAEFIKRGEPVVFAFQKINEHTDGDSDSGE
jgi:hypothetical protein